MSIEVVLEHLVQCGGVLGSAGEHGLYTRLDVALDEVVFVVLLSTMVIIYSLMAYYLMPNSFRSDGLIHLMCIV